MGSSQEVPHDSGPALDSIDGQKHKIAAHASYSSSSSLSEKKIFDLQAMEIDRGAVHSTSSSQAMTGKEILNLDVVHYNDFLRGDVATIRSIRKALLEKGIVGINFKGAPGYQERIQNFIQQAVGFSALDLTVKEKYAPNRKANEYLGYEIGKEQFQRSDGSWVIDQSKASYYFTTTDSPENRWPEECKGLKEGLINMGAYMLSMAKLVLQKIELVKPLSGVELEHVSGVGRMLHYHNGGCGSHFDHGLFTALIPGFYIKDGISVTEPAEAGLFVKTSKEGQFKKVVANDPYIMLFQAGEFGQLTTNDGIKATEHEVRKPKESMERYTLAVFLAPRMDDTIHSTSVLTRDSRYGAKSGEACTYSRWHENSLKRYEVKT